MANTDKCAWCNSYGANNFESNHTGKKYVTVEKFCSQKCYTEYNERYTINWKRKRNSLVTSVIIIFLIIFGSSILNSVNHNSNSTNDSDQIENTNDQEENQENNNNDTSEESINEYETVNFFNDSDSKIFLSYSYFYNESWITLGWYAIDVQSSFELNLPQNFNDNKIYLYANSSQGDIEFEGYDRNFTVDKYSESGFEIVDGTIVKDGGGQKVEKGFYELQLESSTTNCTINNP